MWRTETDSAFLHGSSWYLKIKKWPQQRMDLLRCLVMALGFQTLDLLMDFRTKTCRRCSRTQQLRLWSVECGALAKHKQTAVEWKHGIDRAAQPLFYRWEKSPDVFFFPVLAQHLITSTNFTLATRARAAVWGALCMHVKVLFFSTLMGTLCMQKIPPYRTRLVL